MDHKLLTITIQ